MMMTARIPARFERVAAAFDEDAARLRVRECSSSGSEHSPESSDTDLSDLVKSFMERNERAGEEGGGGEARGGDDGDEAREELLEIENCERSGSDEKENLQRLFEGSEEEDDDGNVKEKIRREVEVARGFVGDNSSSPEFKRRLMSRLREKGFDAGLCKSRWEKSLRFPRGDYEYIDITIGSPPQRYIVEPCLAREFDIARPTIHYASLLGVFPTIFVGKPEDLKKIMRVMCSAIKRSMKCMDLHVPPWRRHGYMQAKWFGSYRRTTNQVSTRTTSSSSSLSSQDVPVRRSISIGFESRAVKVYNCRDDYGKKRSGFRVGLLASALNSDFES